MCKIGVIEHPHIVEEFMIGNTRIRIADDFCRDKTTEEVQKIIDKISRDAANALQRAACGNARNEEL